MAALTEPRDTPAQASMTPAYLRRTVVSAGHVWQGGMVFQRPVSATITSTPSAGTFVLGLAAESGIGGEDIDIRRGVFCFDNSAGADEVTLAAYGQPAYAVDDQTVALTNGGGSRPKAGIIRDVDSRGVWVEI